LSKAISMPMEKRLSEELSKQVEVIERSIKGRQYYVIDSSGGTLACLMALVNNNCPQYYHEMRNGVLKQEVTNAIIDSIGRLPFILVKQSDYNDFSQGRPQDMFMCKVIDFIRKNYDIIDRYDAPQDQSKSIKQIYSFFIMKNMKSDK